MSMWNFTHEKNVDGAGANTEAGFIAGHQPFAEADALPSKRNVIATDKGWVRRQTYTDVHGNVRVKDEVLVAAHPGANNVVDGGYANSQFLAFPDIATVQLGANTADGVATFANTASMDVYVTFNEPLLATANVSIVATSRDGARTFTLLSNNTNDDTSRAVYENYRANNVIVCSGVPGVLAGTYKLRAQALTVAAGGTLVSQNPEASAANTTLTGAVSNTTMDVAGSVLANGEFTLA